MLPLPTTACRVRKTPKCRECGIPPLSSAQGQALTSPKERDVRIVGGGWGPPWRTRSFPTLGVFARGLGESSKKESGLLIQQLSALRQHKRSLHARPYSPPLRYRIISLHHLQVVTRRPSLARRRRQWVATLPVHSSKETRNPATEWLSSDMCHGPEHVNLPRVRHRTNPIICRLQCFKGSASTRELREAANRDSKPVLDGSLVGITVSIQGHVWRRRSMILFVWKKPPPKRGRGSCATCTRIRYCADLVGASPRRMGAAGQCRAYSYEEVVGWCWSTNQQPVRNWKWRSVAVD